MDAPFIPTHYAAVPRPEGHHYGAVRLLRTWQNAQNETMCLAKPEAGLPIVLMQSWLHADLAAAIAAQQPPQTPRAHAA